MPKIPEEIQYKGCRYVLAGRKRGRKSATIKDSGYRHDGILFYINVLCRSKTGNDLPSRFATRVNTIPEGISLNEQETVAAKKAIGDSGKKKDSNLWHILVRDEGWFWADDPKSVQNAVPIQQTLDLVEKYREWDRPGTNPLIYAEIVTKVVGGRKRD